jgi:hypothetical protein
MDEILEPEPLSKDDQLWRNNTEYQILNYIINYIENCDLLMLDYAKHELYSYSPRSEISAILQIIHTKNICILNNKPVPLMNGIYSNHLQYRYLNTNIDYSSKEIQEFIKFIDYNKEDKSNFDFERFHLLNHQIIARNEYDINKRDTLYRKNREEIKIREKIEKETGNNIIETYGKKHTCHIS